MRQSLALNNKRCSIISQNLSCFKVAMVIVVIETTIWLSIVNQLPLDSKVVECLRVTRNSQASQNETTLALNPYLHKHQS